ncbi:hypothetical protein KAW55_02525, partial [bacterium]|nr:hypothetical protein [bacterium]
NATARWGGGKVSHITLRHLPSPSLISKKSGECHPRKNLFLRARRTNFFKRNYFLLGLVRPASSGKPKSSKNACK